MIHLHFTGKPDLLPLLFLCLPQIIDVQEGDVVSFSAPILFLGFGERVRVPHGHGERLIHRKKRYDCQHLIAHFERLLVGIQQTGGQSRINHGSQFNDLIALFLSEFSVFVDCLQ